VIFFPEYQHVAYTSPVAWHAPFLSWFLEQMAFFGPQTVFKLSRFSTFLHMWPVFLNRLYPSDLRICCQPIPSVKAWSRSLPSLRKSEIFLPVVNRFSVRGWSGPPPTFSYPVRRFRAVLFESFGRSWRSRCKFTGLGPSFFFGLAFDRLVPPGRRFLRFCAGF